MPSSPALLLSRLALLLLAGTASAQTAVAPDDAAEGPCPPIATSRFAPSSESIRELRGLGEPAPIPAEGLAMVGDPIDAWTPGRTTILVFWSPLVGDARPHLKRLKEIDAGSDSIDGVSIAVGSRDQVQAVLDGMETRKAKADPPRTILDQTGAWKSAYLDRLGLTSLPSVIAIDPEGRITFQDRLTAVVPPLAAIVSGTWDREQYECDALEYGARMNLMREIDRGRGLAGRGRLDWDQVLELVQEGKRLDPQNTPLLVKEFDILLAEADRPDEAYEAGRRIMRDFPRSPITLNELAWHVVSLPDVSRRDLDFALEASRRGNSAQGWSDSSHLDTLARIHWMRGEEAEAVRLQTLAAGLAPDTWHGDSVRANLEAYTDGRLAPGEMPPGYRSPRRPR